VLRRRGYDRGIVIRRTLVVGLLVCALPLAARRAHGYVRSRSSAGVPVCWPRSTISLELAAGASLPDLPQADLVAAVRAAAATWSAPAVSCTGLTLDVQVSPDARADATVDGHNVITFRQDRWEHQPCTLPEGCAYDPSELIQTSVYARAQTGVVIGADVEINAVRFHWADVLKSKPVGSSYVDLQNALTHDLGHLIGLDHTCYDASRAGAPPVDQHGQPIPACGPNVPDDVKATTMYPMVDVGETSKRDLAPDDVEGVCALFPPTGQPCADQPDGGVGASDGAAPSDGGAPAAPDAAAAPDAKTTTTTTTPASTGGSSG